MTQRTALERCVGDARRFAEEHWGRRPLLHRGGEGFADLLDVGGVDHLVTGTLLRMPGFRLVRDGEPLPPASYTQTIRIGSARVERTARPDRVMDAFADGATIVLQALHRQWPPVARLCRDLELALTHPVQANAYITPATSKGFAVHHDTHDVFVLQTHGRKAWRVYRPVVELAGPEQPWSATEGEPGEAVLEADLGPGDALYIPRGWLHDAEAREEVSIHVTVGITSHTWLDLWRHVMRSAPDHLPFREALPIGYARDPGPVVEDLPTRVKELVAWLEGAAGAEAVRDFARGFWENRRPLLAGQLEQLERLRTADAATRFRRRPGSVFVVSSDEDEAVVLLGLRELRMPAFCLPALRLLERSGTEVRSADLPGLDEASALVLLRRLVREGAAEIVDGGG
jgi:bifunctional lysine-specific demethylase and histidyl-hydroxylase NO66